MQKMVSFLFSALLVLSLPSYAQADIDAAGAEVLKKYVTDTLSYQTEVTKTAGSGLSVGGDVTVTPKDSFYEVSIPDVNVTHATAGKFKVGTILVNAVPNGTDSYNLSMALPSTIVIEAQGDRPKLQLNIGKQRFSCAWTPALDVCTKLDGEYNNVVIDMVETNGKNTAQAVIGSLKPFADLEKNPDNTWSGTKTFEIRDVKVTATGMDNANVSVEKIITKSQYEKIDLAAATQMSRKVMEMVKSGATPSAEAQKSLMNDALKQMNSVGDGATNAFEMTGLKADIRPGKDTKHPAKSLEPIVFSVAKVASQFDVKGITQERGNAGMKLNLEGLAIEGQNADFTGIIPTKGNIDIALENLPMKEIGNAFGQVMRQALDSSFAIEDTAGTVYEAKAKADAQQQVFIALASFPQLLANAGSKLVIRNSYVDAPELLTTLEGSFTAGTTSPMLAVGTMTLTFNGLDETIAMLQAKAQKPGTDPRVAGMAQTMIFVQQQGQLSQGSGGKSARVFKLEATADGKLLMNGIDMSMMLGMMGGAMGGMNGGAMNAPAPGGQPQRDTLPQVEETPATP